MTPLRLAVIGCGSRGRTYAAIAATLGDRCRLVAAADPHPGSLAAVERAAGHPLARFPGARELLAARPPVDLAIVSTPDDRHAAPGYHGHGGGDFGLINALDQLVRSAPPDEWFESHLIAFAAEQSRHNGGQTVELEPLR